MAADPTEQEMTDATRALAWREERDGDGEAVGSHDFGHPDAPASQMARRHATGSAAGAESESESEPADGQDNDAAR